MSSTQTGQLIWGEAMHPPSRSLGLLLLALTATASAQLELEGPGEADDSIQDADVAALENWLRDMREASSQENGDGADPTLNLSMEELVANSRERFDALMEQCMVDDSILAEREDAERRLSELGEDGPIGAVRELQARLLSLRLLAQRDCCERGEILCTF